MHLRWPIMKTVQGSGYSNLYSHIQGCKKDYLSKDYLDNGK